MTPDEQVATKLDTYFKAHDATMEFLSAYARTMKDSARTTIEPAQSKITENQATLTRIKKSKSTGGLLARVASAVNRPFMPSSAPEKSLPREIQKHKSEIESTKALLSSAIKHTAASMEIAQKQLSIQLQSLYNSPVLNDENRKALMRRIIENRNAHAGAPVITWDTFDSIIDSVLSQVEKDFRKSTRNPLEEELDRTAKILRRKSVAYMPSVVPPEPLNPDVVTTHSATAAQEQHMQKVEPIYVEFLTEKTVEDKLKNLTEKEDKTEADMLEITALETHLVTLKDVRDRMPGIMVEVAAQAAATRAARNSAKASRMTAAEPNYVDPKELNPKPAPVYATVGPAVGPAASKSTRAVGVPPPIPAMPAGGFKALNERLEAEKRDAAAGYITVEEAREMVKRPQSLNERLEAEKRDAAAGYITVEEAREMVKRPQSFSEAPALSASKTILHTAPVGGGNASPDPKKGPTEPPRIALPTSPIR